MRYIVFILGLAIIVLRILGFEIDITSVGLFAFISIMVLVKNLDSLSEFSGLGMKFKFNSNLKKLSKDIEEEESKIEIEKHKTPLDSISGIPETELETEETKFDSEPAFKIKPKYNIEKELEDLQDNDVDHFESEFEKLDDNYIPDIYDIDFSNPKIALIELAIEIEKKLKSISQHQLGNEKFYRVSPRHIMRDLVERNLVSVSFGEIFESFWQLRNQIVHGVEHKYSDSQIISLLESGLKILKFLNVINRNKSGGLFIKG